MCPPSVFCGVSLVPLFGLMSPCFHGVFLVSPCLPHVLLCLLYYLMSHFLSVVFLSCLFLPDVTMTDFPVAGSLLLSLEKGNRWGGKGNGSNKEVIWSEDFQHKWDAGVLC